MADFALVLSGNQPNLVRMLPRSDGGSAVIYHVRKECLSIVNNLRIRNMLLEPLGVFPGKVMEQI